MNCIQTGSKVQKRSELSRKTMAFLIAPSRQQQDFYRIKMTLQAKQAKLNWCTITSWSLVPSTDSLSTVEWEHLDKCLDLGQRLIKRKIQHLLQEITSAINSERRCKISTHSSKAQSKSAVSQTTTKYLHPSSTIEQKNFLTSLYLTIPLRSLSEQEARSTTFWLSHLSFKLVRRKNRSTTKLTTRSI
jgi:hypothetical protein